MARRSQTIEIDPNKLREELRRRGLNVTALSKELGYNSQYMSQALKNGSIGMPAANQLELRYNIDMELMKPDAEQKTEEPEVNTEEINSLKEEIQELTRTLKELTEEFSNYKVQMLQFMRKFENYRKFGHM